MTDDEHQGFRSVVKSSILFLLFELIGTMLMTLLQTTVYGTSINYVLGVWVLILFSWKISGAHFNPAISLAFMLRKDVGKFPRPLGLAYILF